MYTYVCLHMSVIVHVCMCGACLSISGFRVHIYDSVLGERLSYRARICFIVTCMTKKIVYCVCERKGMFTVKCVRMHAYVSVCLRGRARCASEKLARCASGSLPCRPRPVGCNERVERWQARPHADAGIR